MERKNKNTYVPDEFLKRQIRRDLADAIPVEFEKRRLEPWEAKDIETYKMITGDTDVYKIIGVVHVVVTPDSELGRIDEA